MFCDSILLGGYVTSVCRSSMMFLHQNLLDKWTNTEVKCLYQVEEKEIGDVEMKIFFGFIIVIGFLFNILKMFCNYGEKKRQSYFQQN